MTIDHLEIRDEIDSAIRHARNVMPAEIKELIVKLNRDLYGGPSYYDAEGEECSCFDEGAEAFKFGAALEAVRTWIEANVEDIEIEVYNDVDLDIDYYDEPATYFERIDGSARQIIVALLGAELAAML